MQLGISADVVPVSLDLNAEDLHFEFSADNWDPHIDKVLVMDNPNKFPVEYSVECTSGNGTFSVVSPPSGVVKPSSSGELIVRWSPPLDGSASGTTQQGGLVLTMVGGGAVWERVEVKILA